MSAVTDDDFDYELHEAALTAASEDLRKECASIVISIDAKETITLEKLEKLNKAAGFLYFVINEAP